MTRFRRKAHHCDDCCSCDCCADIVVRLRSRIKAADGASYPNGALFEEAAVKIENLRESLKTWERALNACIKRERRRKK